MNKHLPKSAFCCCFAWVDFFPFVDYEEKKFSDTKLVPDLPSMHNESKLIIDKQTSKQVMKLLMRIELNQQRNFDL
jgi:hypothetical protein